MNDKARLFGDRIAVVVVHKNWPSGELHLKINMKSNIFDEAKVTEGCWLTQNRLLQVMIRNIFEDTGEKFMLR